VANREMIRCACAIFAREQRLLLAKRAAHEDDSPNCWDLIGWHVEPVETIEPTLIRDAREEVGLTPLRFAAVGIIKRTRELRSKPLMSYHFFIETEWSGGEAVMLGEEHAELRWFTIEEECALGVLPLADYRDLFRDLPLLARLICSAGQIESRGRWEYTQD
jgi:8-oxo-dGTP diphosphatase